MSNGKGTGAGVSRVKHPGEKDLEKLLIDERKKKIKHKLLVLSGKGGVGKSTVAANTAISLALSGKKVGLLDIDVHGPSIPRLLGLEGNEVKGTEEVLYPVRFSENLEVMSIGFMLKESDLAVIWRGPMKHGVIKQFLANVEWGDLDYLIVDSPPGTGDEPLSIAQLLGESTGAIIVTTPQELALSDVRKCITFCRQLNLAIIGVIENMSGFICPHCGKEVDIFKSGGGEKMAAEMGVPFLGKIPVDPDIVTTGDEGKPYIQLYAQSEASKKFKEAILPILEMDGDTHTEKKEDNTQVAVGKTIKIAMPILQGKMALHFGHSNQFAVVEVNPETRSIIKKEMFTPPSHEPGVLPNWLNKMGVGLVITGGMGMRAQNIFRQNNIDVVVGVSPDIPENIVKAYLDGALVAGDNICGH
ncbi:MAG: P-loop NTPase [Candidatus Eremiobacteraeota bacterium]|nr:P-loop NTPase [Candidatus Eremiobacteraeota bacterium]